MSELLSLKKDEEALNKAFQKLNPDFNYISFGRMETLIVDAIKEAMGDKDDWIGYFIYELDWGNKAKKDSVQVKGKNVPCKTLENLYDLIVK